MLIRRLGRPVSSMQGPRFRTESVDESFFDAAPFRMATVFEIPRPAEAVWSDLIGEDALSWCRIIRRIEWTSPPPYGEGATRTAYLLGGLSVIEERFFRWEAGRRQSFHALSTSAPMWRRLAEDYLVEPISDSSCRFEWTIATEPRALARGANPINRLILETMFRDTERHYGLI